MNELENRLLDIELKFLELQIQVLEMQSKEGIIKRFLKKTGKIFAKLIFML